MFILYFCSGEGERCYEGAKSATAAASPSYTRPSFSSPPQHHPCHNPISVRITGVTEIALGGSGGGGFPSPCGSNRSAGGTTFLPHTTTSDSEVGVASGVGAETSLKVGSGSWVGSETNHSGSTNLLACEHFCIFYICNFSLETFSFRDVSFANPPWFFWAMMFCCWMSANFRLESLFELLNILVYL